MFDFGAPSAPVANWGVLGFPEALTIYNFIYSRFPSTAGSGPSPSMATHFRRVGLGASCRISSQASRLATDRPHRGAGGNLVLRREPRAACSRPTETPHLRCVVPPGRAGRPTGPPQGRTCRAVSYAPASSRSSTWLAHVLPTDRDTGLGFSQPPAPDALVPQPGARLSAGLSNLSASARLRAVPPRSVFSTGS